jgi:hypothetical protein
MWDMASKTGFELIAPYWTMQILFELDFLGTLPKIRHAFQLSTPPL